MKTDGLVQTLPSVLTLGLRHCSTTPGHALGSITAVTTRSITVPKTPWEQSCDSQGAQRVSDV